MNQDKPILVVGASGYVGGRLVPRLLESGYSVRALARSPEKITCRPWGRHPRLEVVAGDVLDRDSLTAAATGCGPAVYLVHSMIAKKQSFAAADRRAAHNMVAAAAKAKLTFMIYLGGLGDIDEADLSKHLRSRHEVGEILQAGAVPCTVLRAAMILGSGSASFEILRYLVERLPVMITPRWVHSPNQPIAISNILQYIQGCLETPGSIGGTFDIGGPDVLTYHDLIDLYAEAAGLPRRRVIPVPVLTPTLSACWIHLITPVPADIARPLTEGLTSAAVCRENRIRELIPLRLVGCREAIQKALDLQRQYQVESCWRDADGLLTAEWAYCGDAAYAGGTIRREAYRMRTAGSNTEVWQVVSSLGGRTGWHATDILWRLRGAVDRLVGGIGMRRGRRHPADLQVGDALDFWRVLAVEPPRRLLLAAEMKMPGRALLEFQIQQLDPQEVELQAQLRFLPRGIIGLAYWSLVAPLHRPIFRRLLTDIAGVADAAILEGPQPFDPLERDACRISSP
jgi:uncharacterized protein YbjT (DUF2867 family)